MPDVKFDRLKRILVRLLDEEEFLSPYGLRSLSRYHLAHPFTLSAGERESSVLTAKTVPRTGFETVIPIAGRPHFVAVTALDQGGRPLGTSRTVAVR